MTSQHDCRILGVFSAPGGAGKTTISAILGWKLREIGKDVLIIDMDPSISLSWLFVNDDRELIEIEKKNRTLTALIKKIIIEGDNNVDISDYIISKPFPSIKDSLIDVIVPDLNLIKEIDSYWFGPTARKEYLLKTIFDVLDVRKQYDYVIIDTIPFYDRKYAIIVLYGADKCLIPLRPTIIDVYRTGTMLRDLPKLTGLSEDTIFSQISLLFNQVRRGTKQEKLVAKYEQIFKSHINPNIKIFRAKLPFRISFSRIGTEDEASSDRNDVTTSFEPFFREFQQWI